jgi:phosphoribosylformylglycinamidine synthase subunit PurSL
MYQGQEVGVLSMDFLHNGRPPVVRSATFTPPVAVDTPVPSLDRTHTEQALLKILGSLNVASKHWIIRQYDHEVQSGSAIKPLVGPSCSGPGDAAVVRPRLNSQRGVVISCGMNPNYGDHDPYHMAASAIDEAVRNAIAVGADPSRLAILDNFCWGNTDRPETLGTLVRAALACHDIAVAWQTPFISGKDSLNNEFTWMDDTGVKQSIAIPSSLLISAMGQVKDVRQCVTMDLKQVGNAIYLVGKTYREFGGSHLFQVLGTAGGVVPQVRTAAAKSTFDSVHAAISKGLVRACHDLSEGGLAVALSEMAFAGELGVQVDLAKAIDAQQLQPTELLFAESNSRFLIEVEAGNQKTFEQLMSNVPCIQIGSVTDQVDVRIQSGASTLVDLPWRKLFQAWHSPLDL